MCVDPEAIPIFFRNYSLFSAKIDENSEQHRAIPIGVFAAPAAPSLVANAPAALRR
jgi:hypothetical protein